MQGIDFTPAAGRSRSCDFSRKRVGVVGTGSSGVQVIPLIAEQAEHLYVFQRTPSFVAPARNRPIDPDYRAEWDKNFFELKRKAREETSNGTLTEYPKGSAWEVSAEHEREYQRRWDKGGSLIMHSYNDLMTDIAANDTLADFVRRKIQETVEDPKVARALTPTDYPVGAKRICIGTNYYETFNRRNVTLVSIKDAPICRFTAKGLETDNAEYPLDALVFATDRRSDWSIGSDRDSGQRRRDAKRKMECWSPRLSWCHVGRLSKPVPHDRTGQSFCDRQCRRIH